MTQANEPPVSQQSAGDDHHRPPDDKEVVYFEGRPMLRADQLKLALWLLLAIAILLIPVAAWMYGDFSRWWLWLGMVVLAPAVVAVPWLKIRTTRYRISNYRIDFERGILTKKIDTLELWHVEDIHFEQNLLDRVFNVGCIMVLSNDKTTPKLDLHGVPNPRQIFDALKQRVIAVKRQRGVLKMDMG